MIADMFNLILAKATAADVVSGGGIDITLPDTISLKGDGGLTKLWTDVSGLVFAFLAVMAFGGIIYSGIMMITSGGDATKFAAGKKNLIWSIIGIVIVVLSYVILVFVGKLTLEVIK